MKTRASLAFAAALALAANAAAAQPPAQPATPAPAPVPRRAGEPAPHARVIDLRPKFRKGQEIRLNAQISSREIVVTPSTPSPRTPASPATRPATPAQRPGSPRQPNSTAPATAPGAPAASPAPEPSAFSQEVGLLLRVTSADPERGSTADLVFESFKLKGNTAVGEVDFDSTRKSNDKDDPIAEAMRGIVGLTLEIVLDRDGNITSAQPKRGAHSAADDLSTMLSGAFTGGDLVKSLVGPITSARPGAASVRVGETWTEQSRMGAPGGEWTIDVTKTFSAVRGSIATIDMRGEVRLDNASPGGATLGVTADAPYRGTCEWDFERGMLKRVESTLRMRSSAPTADIPQQVHESRLTITRVGG